MPGALDRQRFDSFAAAHSALQLTTYVARIPAAPFSKLGEGGFAPEPELKLPGSGESDGQGREAD